MEQGTELAATENYPAGTSPRSSGRRLTGASLGIMIVLFALILLILDFSEVLFARSRREQALRIITPSMRLTQAERALNSAGYLTLYIDNSPPYLQVSTLSDPPFTARAIHRLFPGSPPDDWLRTQLTLSSRFYVKADATGSVKFTPAGKVDHTLSPPPDMPPELTL